MSSNPGPANLRRKFSQPLVDLIVYLCRVTSEEGFDLHRLSQRKVRLP
jgi:hypothetical protein